MTIVASTIEATALAGIDWAAENHAVHVMDPSGRRRDAFEIAHSRTGLEALVKRLARFGPAAAIPVAVERPDGRLVDVLLEAGHPVVPVQPNAIKAWRDAEVLSGAKSDPGDAEVIAEYLRLRRHRLRVVQPYSAATKALRTVVRARDDLVAQRTAAHNQLEALLQDTWPGAIEVFADVTSAICLDFLEKYPTWNSARLLGEKRMASFLVKHGYSGRRPASELLARLRRAPDGIDDVDHAEAARDAVLGYVEVLRSLNRSIKNLDRSIAAHLGEHPDGKIFTSLPRSGQVNAAQMLAEWGDSREAYDGPDAVAMLAGLAPVTKHSGKHHAVHFRWACNKRFRNAMTTFADNSRHASPWAAKVYADARDRGCDHPHAVRVLARAWTRVIYRCWIDATPYDANRHRNAARLLLDEAA
jgi:transposase